MDAVEVAYVLPSCLGERIVFMTTGFLEFVNVLSITASGGSGRNSRGMSEPSEGWGFRTTGVDLCNGSVSCTAGGEVSACLTAGRDSC